MADVTLNVATYMKDADAVQTLARAREIHVATLMLQAAETEIQRQMQALQRGKISDVIREDFRFQLGMIEGLKFQERLIDSCQKHLESFGG